MKQKATHYTMCKEEEEEEMRSPGRAHRRHIPMVPAGPHRSDRDRQGGLCPDPSG